VATERERTKAAYKADLMATVERGVERGKCSDGI
jgi:hypothetical protein